jgi:hypothetical protein
MHFQSLYAISREGRSGPGRKEKGDESDTQKKAYPPVFLFESLLLCGLRADRLFSISGSSSYEIH